MAERRMFAKAIIGSGRFLQMPPSSRLLYYDLGMAADDDGIVEAFSVMRLTGASEDDLKVLVAKGFVRVLNEEMVSYITDWKVNNYIRGDRYQPSIYKPLMVGLDVVDQRYTNGIPTADKRSTQYRLGKDSIGEDSTGEVREATPPSGDPLIMFAADSLVGMNADLAEELTSYRAQMTDDMIRWAINQTLASGSRAFSYTRSILNRIVECGFKTLGEVKAAEEKRRKEKDAKPAPNYGKPQKPMDSRTVDEGEFEGLYADIMNRPRCKRGEG